MKVRAINHLTYQDSPTNTLSEAEIKNPLLVFDDLFDYARLPQLQQMLWESFKSNVTGSFNEKLSNPERRDIICLHEYLEKLLEAVYILHKRQKSKANSFPS